jgi:hypothetical protein
MRVYIPDSDERDIQKSLTELELFKQSVSCGGRNHRQLVFHIEKIIFLLSDKDKCTEVVRNLKEIHAVIGVETDDEILKRIKEATRLIIRLSVGTDKQS